MWWEHLGWESGALGSHSPLGAACPVTSGCLSQFRALLSPELGTWRGRAGGLYALLALMFDEFGDVVPLLGGALDAVS